MDEEIKKSIVESQSAILNSDIEDFKVENINELLSYTDDQLKLLSKEDCDIVAYNITRHKLFVQSKINRNRAYLNKLKITLRQIVAKDITQFKGMSWDYAEQNAINNNDVALEIQNKISQLEEYITLAYGISSILDDFLKRYESIKFWRLNNE